MHRINISEPADRDIQHAFEWWRDNRSAEQASRWFAGILTAIQSLHQDPDRCPPAPETDLHPRGLRELHFGIGRRPTHRVVFTIDGKNILIVRVRHFAQQKLAVEDIEADIS